MQLKDNSDLSWLIYADWLQEQGDEVGANEIRVKVESPAPCVWSYEWGDGDGGVGGGGGGIGGGGGGIGGVGGGGVGGIGVGVGGIGVGGVGGDGGGDV